MKDRTAVDLLEQVPPPAYLAEWSDVVARPNADHVQERQSSFIFRVADGWLGLPTSAVKEVVSVKQVHSLPHRTNRVVLGLTNVGGELLVCVSLSALLGLDRADPSNADRIRTAHRRFVVIAGGDVRVVCTVDEVFGIHRFDPRELTDVPATLAKATVRHTRALLSWKDHSVGLLDDQLLFHTLKRSIA